jgi:sodium transport system ATP-binding protein
MIRTQGLTKHFAEKKSTVVAVDHVSFEAQPGRVFCLLGVNGAGKTTVLRMLSTVIQPTEGSATVAGYDVVKDGAKVRASIGFMSNSTALYGRLTGLEILQYFGGLYGLEGKVLRDRLDFVIDKLALEDFKNRLCDKMSTGQKQRVSIARTILHDPPVLFFDEPTAGLDVVTSQSVMEFIENSRAQGKTIVYCTHIMSEVERLGDDVVVIHEGEIRGQGTVQQLLGQTGEKNLERAFLSLVRIDSENAANRHKEAASR